MPILHWLNKDQAVTTAKHSAYRLLEEVLELSYGDGQCLFIMAVEQDKQGRDIRQQILSVIE